MFAKIEFAHLLAIAISFLLIISFAGCLGDDDDDDKDNDGNGDGNGGNGNGNGNGGGGGGNGSSDKERNSTNSDEGYLDEGTETDYVYDVKKTVLNATFILNWTDEEDSGTGAENEGDTFNLTVITPTGTEYYEEVTNAHGEEGRIVIEVDYRPDGIVGAWNLTVGMVEAGDHTTNGVPTVVDSGNDYILTYHWYYRG